jgi:hypothetical protein
LLEGTNYKKKFWNQYQLKNENFKEGLRVLQQSVNEPQVREQKIKQI